MRNMNKWFHKYRCVETSGFYDLDFKNSLIFCLNYVKAGNSLIYKKLSTGIRNCRIATILETDISFPQLAMKLQIMGSIIANPLQTGYDNLNTPTRRGRPCHTTKN